MASKAITGVLALIFFLGTLILVNPSNLYVSPDETANAYFATLFSQTASFQGTFDALVQSLDGRLHPRSSVSVDGVLLPGSFLGLPFLYGAIAALLGTWIFWILTPIITVFAAFAWGRIIERFTTPLIGKLSFGLFLLHPAVWYYSARGLMHNVLFVDLLVLSAWMFLERPLRRSAGSRGIVNDIIAGVLLGLALFVRTSELYWILGGLLLAGACWMKQVSLRRLSAAFLGLTLGLTLLFGMNLLTYGGPLQTGYTIGATQIQDLQTGDTLDALTTLPFGFHPMNAWRHLLSYGVEMFWWMSALALLGFFVLLSQKRHAWTIRSSLVVAALISLWLVFMYGSWEIHDNPDPTQITMANSYVRYWLPMYLFSTPMIAAAIVWIGAHGRSRVAQALIVGTLCLLVVSLNVRAVFVQGQDGLVTMRQELQESATIQESVLRLTPGNAVIIVERADKLFFPERRVLYPLRDETTYAAMPVLVSQAPLYYYGITFPEVDLAYLNGSRLKRMDLQIELVQTYNQESLYHIFSP
ncbi:hypothetical protein HZA87_04540 [Candidatus Uhrbacteria bacterium]|nr:hypothetical protein [Candidatus Uhrbacteria bacterium]